MILIGIIKLGFYVQFHTLICLRALMMTIWLVWSISGFEHFVFECTKKLSKHPQVKKTRSHNYRVHAEKKIVWWTRDRAITSGLHYLI